MWTAVEETNMEALLAVMKKKFRLVQLVEHSLHSCEDHFHIRFFNCSSHVWFSCISSRLFTTLRVYLEQNNDQLPVSLLAQLIEHCTGIVEVMGSNPVQAWILFRHDFHFYLSCVHNCEDRYACVAFIWGQGGTGLLQSTSPWRWLLVYLAAGSKICSFLLPIERHHGHRIWDISAQGARLDRWLQYRSSKCW